VVDVSDVAEPDEEPSAEETVSYLRDVMRDFARERLLEHAVTIMRRFDTLPATEVSDDDFERPWPYAGPLAETSLASELFWAMKQNHIPGYAEIEYRSRARDAAERHFCKLSDAEQHFFIQAFWPDDDRNYTLAEQERFASSRLANEVLNFARDYDADVLEEWP
jgi:hypothetical protein